MSGYSVCGRHDRAYPSNHAMCPECVDEELAVRQRARDQYERENPRVEAEEDTGYVSRSKCQWCQCAPCECPSYDENST